MHVPASLHRLPGHLPEPLPLIGSGTSDRLALATCTSTCNFVLQLATSYCDFVLHLQLRTATCDFNLRLDTALATSTYNFVLHFLVKRLSIPDFVRTAVVLPVLLIDCPWSPAWSLRAAAPAHLTVLHIPRAVRHLPCHVLFCLTRRRLHTREGTCLLP